mmetsp:Transcript_15580/g.27645  ORF Transcript_15580/g.27645 Transcript_15580/m.27645 type:complete len:114 (-) Transcript_15580:359-700(-)
MHTAMDGVVLDGGSKMPIVLYTHICRCHCGPPTILPQRPTRIGKHTRCTMMDDGIQKRNQNLCKFNLQHLPPSLIYPPYAVYNILCEGQAHSLARTQGAGDSHQMKKHGWTNG